MLTDEQWLVLGPLVEACRPLAKVASPTLRQTMCQSALNSFQGTASNIFQLVSMVSVAVCGV